MLLTPPFSAVFSSYKIDAETTLASLRRGLLLPGFRSWYPNRRITSTLRGRLRTHFVWKQRSAIRPPLGRATRSRHSSAMLAKWWLCGVTLRAHDKRRAMPFKRPHINNISCRMLCGAFVRFCAAPRRPARAWRRRHAARTCVLPAPDKNAILLSDFHGMECRAHVSNKEHQSRDMKQRGSQVLRSLDG